MTKRSQKSMWFASLLAAGATLTSTTARAQTLDWGATRFFQYNIEATEVRVDATSGQRSISVLFSVTDPTQGQLPWDIKTNPMFRQPAGVSRLGLLVGWDNADYHNTGATRPDLAPVAFGNGIGAALPLSVDLVRDAIPVGGKYVVTVPLPPQAVGSATVAIEGHPAWPSTVNGVTTYNRVPVKSVAAPVAVTDNPLVTRRQIVAIEKCQACHDGRIHGTHEIPRLSLHGANRNENLAVCVICHNPNQTDIPYRLSGPETPVDFKYMVHAIHGNKRRQNPYVVIGRGGTVNDFSTVQFPANPRDCARCHLDSRGVGTFELPISPDAQGTTYATGSVPGTSVDLDPNNNLRLTPTMSACSACHDSRKALAHMTSSRSGGAVGVLQSDIDDHHVAEQCVKCHGPGREKSVRKVHR